MKFLSDSQAERFVGGGSLITVSPQISTKVSPSIDLDNTFALNNQANFANSIAFAVLGSKATSSNGIMRNRARIRSFS